MDTERLVKFIREVASYNTNSGSRGFLADRAIEFGNKAKALVKEIDYEDIQNGSEASLKWFPVSESGYYFSARIMNDILLLAVYRVDLANPNTWHAKVSDYLDNSIAYQKGLENLEAAKLAAVEMARGILAAGLKGL